MDLSKKIIKSPKTLSKIIIEDGAVNRIDEERSKLSPPVPFSSYDDNDETNDTLESQMTVCVRARPVLEHEMSAGHINCVHTANPVVLVTEPVVRSVSIL